MQIVTDSATNIELVVAPELASLAHIVPLSVTLDGHNYRDGIDLSPQEFYQRLASTGRLPVTSQPSAGEFTELYRHLAATDPEILSIHMSGGLSGTVNSATVAAAEVSEAHVTVVDTKTLSTPAGRSRRLCSGRRMAGPLSRSCSAWSASGNRPTPSLH